MAPHPARLIAQVVIIGSQILGRAFIEAYKQAAKNASARQLGSSESPGASNSAAKLTRTYRMGLDEARNILNLSSSKPLEELHSLQTRPPSKTLDALAEAAATRDSPAATADTLVRNYDHLFKVNDPSQGGSIYLQSKIVRARERIEAELMELERIRLEKEASQRTSTSSSNARSSSSPPPPPS